MTRLPGRKFITVTTIKGENLKKTLPPNLEKYRRDHPFYVEAPAGSIEGFFVIPYGDQIIAVISGSGENWDHVSASLKNRTPTWQEMNWIKNLFFEPEETVIQIHPPQSQYVNVASNALHLWRCWDQVIKLPPRSMLA
jgi:hypothetical protein